MAKWSEYLPHTWRYHWEKVFNATHAGSTEKAAFSLAALEAMLDRIPEFLQDKDPDVRSSVESILEICRTLIDKLTEWAEARTLTDEADAKIFVNDLKTRLNDLENAMMEISRET